MIASIFFIFNVLFYMCSASQLRIGSCGFSNGDANRKNFPAETDNRLILRPLRAGCFFLASAGHRPVCGFLTSG
jgi:hypothetical protein